MIKVYRDGKKNVNVISETFERRYEIYCELIFNRNTLLAFGVMR